MVRSLVHSGVTQETWDRLPFISCCRAAACGQVLVLEKRSGN